MKKYLPLFVCLVISFLMPLQMWAQGSSVDVTVHDPTGPVIGAGVLVKGTTIGAATDENGRATIPNVSSETVLVISSVGYVTQEIMVGNRRTISVLLREDSELLNETVVVGYGTQRKESLTSAITSVRAEEVTKTKQTDVVTTLQGKVPGLMIRQAGGTAGRFYSNLSLRGYGVPIVVIDGVVRSEAHRDGGGFGVQTDLALAQLNPDDIESISVLKDASASIYGLGAGNGVILVTTKKGQLQRKPNVSYQNSFSFGNPKLPKPMGMVDFMNVSNEMADNARLARPYTEDEINEYAKGSKKPFNWWEECLKDFAFSHMHNVSVRGGSDRIQYYMGGSFTKDNSLYKTKNNFTYRRYTLRGNFTVKITDDLTMDFQTSVRATLSKDPYNQERHGDPTNMIFNYIAYADRRVGPTTLANPGHYTYQGGAPTYNPMALMDHDLNYTDKRGRLFTNTLNLRYEAPFLKGLSLSLQGAYDFNYNGTYDKETTYPLYDYYTDEIMGTGGNRNYYGESVRENERYYGRFQANYNWRKGRHRVAVMGAAEATKNNMRNLSGSRQFGDFYTHNTVSSGDPSTASADGTRTETATAGYLGRINYDFADKYLVELMGRYDATYLYARGHRWGFFPSYSLGWRISEEPFIKNNLPWVSMLKLRWSDGKTGLTQGAPYAYETGYSASSPYVFSPGSVMIGYANTEIANTIITWANIQMIDFGVDWNFWKDKFGGTFDIFSRKTTGIAGTSSGSVPTILGVNVPQINVDSRLNVGMELTLTHRNHIGAFNYNVALTGTYTRMKNLHVESQATSLWPSNAAYYGTSLFGRGSTQNRWSNYRGLWYYKTEGGQFHNWQEINSSQVKYDASYGMQTTVPGQYIILDHNGDGYITGEDINYKWSESNAPLQFGLNIGGSYKNLDVNMVWQGATNVSKIIWLLHVFGYGGYTDLYEMYLDRYHVATPGADPYDPNTVWTEGYWPALVDANGPGVLRQGVYDFPTDFTQIDGTYFRLKSVEIGYTFPRNLLGRVGIQSVRVFAGGTNLWTICTKKMKYYDPEASAGMHGSVMPIMRTINLGVNLNF